MMLYTPYFVIDEQVLNEQYKKLTDALEKYWNNYIIGYSYKTNSLPWIVNHMSELGCYSEVVSSHEYALGKELGVSAGNFVYNGPIKTKESMFEVLEAGGYVNIDSKRELEWLADLDTGRNYHIGIRANYDIEMDCPGQSSGGDEGSRFGFCYENGELKDAIDYVRQLGFTVDGLHMHFGSKTRSIDIYRAIARKMCIIAKEYDLELSFVDIGGGYFGGLANKPQFADYLEVISGELSKYFDASNTTLIMEPGMSLIGSPISYVTSVIDVKDTTYGRFVITDGTRTHLDPLGHKSSYFYKLETNGERAIVPSQSIVGYTCMENDRIMKVADSAELAVGDRITYDKVGAYTMCLSPLFIKYFPAVYVRNAGELKLIRREWEPKDYMSGCTR